MSTLLRLAIREAWCSLLALAMGREVMYWHTGLVMPHPSRCVVCFIKPDEMPDALAAFAAVGMREELLAMRELHEKYIEAVNGA